MSTPDEIIAAGADADARLLAAVAEEELLLLGLHPDPAAVAERDLVDLDALDGPRQDGRR